MAGLDIGKHHGDETFPRQHVRVGDVTYGLPLTPLHGRRDDGTYLTLYIDAHMEPDRVNALLMQQREERSRLVDAGITVT